VELRGRSWGLLEKITVSGFFKREGDETVERVKIIR